MSSNFASWLSGDTADRVKVTLIYNMVCYSKSQLYRLWLVIGQNLLGVTSVCTSSWIKKETSYFASNWIQLHQTFMGFFSLNESLMDVLQFMFDASLVQFFLHALYLESPGDSERQIIASHD